MYARNVDIGRGGERKMEEEKKRKTKTEKKGRNEVCRRGRDKGREMYISEWREKV